MQPISYPKGFQTFFPGDPNFGIKILRNPKQFFLNLSKQVRGVSLLSFTSQSLYQGSGLFWLPHFSLFCLNANFAFTATC